MTRVDLHGVYGAAGQIGVAGISGGDWLAKALSDISHDAVAAACGHDKMGDEMFKGFGALTDNLANAGKDLKDSLVNLGDGVAAGGNRIAATDSQNADAITAADLGLLPDGKPLPPDPSTPSR